jgi:hypothetical protein
VTSYIPKSEDDTVRDAIRLIPRFCLLLFSDLFGVWSFLSLIFLDLFVVEDNSTLRIIYALYSLWIHYYSKLLKKELLFPKIPFFVTCVGIIFCSSLDIVLSIRKEVFQAEIRKEDGKFFHPLCYSKYVKLNNDNNKINHHNNVHNKSKRKSMTGGNSISFLERIQKYGSADFPNNEQSTVSQELLTMYDMEVR